MPWFKVDDKLHSHKKAARAGTDAIGLWVLCGSWSMDQLTDGFVPDYVACRFDSRARKLADKLVRAGLWVVGEHDGDEGWCFHDWDQMQPTRDQVESKREHERDKKRNQRRNTAGQFTESPNVSPGDTIGTAEGVPGGVKPSRPDPTQREEKTSSTGVDGDFETWWEHVPRKVGKGQARRAYRSARKKTDHDTLVAAIDRYAAQVRGSNPQFIAHPSTWLNGERWADETPPDDPRIRTTANGEVWDLGEWAPKELRR